MNNSLPDNTTEIPASNILLEATTGHLTTGHVLGNVSQSSSTMDTVRIAIAIIHITVFFFGLAGNGIILYTMLKVVRNRNVTDLYILSLAISDFLFVATLPFLATDMLTKNNWVFGPVVCRIFVGVNYFVLCAGVLIVTAMSVDRFQNVVFAVKMMGVRTTRRAKIIICCLWGFSVIYMIPATISASVLVTNNETDHKACTLHYEDIGKIPAKTVLAVHTIFRFVVAFLIPFVIMVCCNVTIIHFLRKRRSKKQKKKSKFVSTQTPKDHKAHTHKNEEDRITRLILLVTSVFLICFLPNLILNTLHVLGPSALRLLNIHYGETMHMFRWSSVCLLYVNSALNPFLYAFSGSGFRKRIKDALLGRTARKNYIKGTTQKSPQATRATPLLTPKAEHPPKVLKEEDGTPDPLPTAVVMNAANGGQNCTVSAFVCYEAATDRVDALIQKPDDMMHQEGAGVYRGPRALYIGANTHKLQQVDGHELHNGSHLNVANDNDSGFSAAFECDETEPSPKIASRAL